MADFISVPGDDTDLLCVVIERQADGLEFQFSGPSVGTYAAYDAANPTRSAANLTSITGPNDHVLSAVPTGFANPAVTPVATNLEIKVYSRAGANVTAAELSASPVWVGWATWDGSALVSQASYRAGLSATSAYSADEKLTTGRLNLLDRLATMIEQIGSTGVWRYLQSAFPAAPAGYGGSTQVRVGGGRLSPVASGLDGQIASFVSDVLPIRFDLVGQDGQAIPHNGATLTGTLTNAAGAVQASAVTVSTTGMNVAEGELLATVTLPATAGTYQLTITRTASATDVQTFGPFAIKAGRK